MLNVESCKQYKHFVDIAFVRICSYIFAVGSRNHVLTSPKIEAMSSCEALLFLSAKSLLNDISKGTVTSVCTYSKSKKEISLMLVHQLQARRKELKKKGIQNGYFHCNAGTNSVCNIHL